MIQRLTFKIKSAWPQYLHVLHRTPFWGQFSKIKWTIWNYFTFHTLLSAYSGIPQCLNPHLSMAFEILKVKQTSVCCATVQALQKTKWLAGQNGSYNKIDCSALRNGLLGKKIININWFDYFQLLFCLFLENMTCFDGQLCKDCYWLSCLQCISPAWTPSNVHCVLIAKALKL